MKVYVLSYHVMPLVISALGGKDDTPHTRKHTHTNVQLKAISRNQAHA